MRPLILLAALVLIAPPPPPPLQVTANGGRVTIKATRVPLSEILRELARKTGMEVVYESAVPRQPITVAIENLPEEDAIAKLLDGVPLSWGVKLSANRLRVERLVLADPSKRKGTQRDAAKPGTKPDAAAQPEAAVEPEVAADPGAAEPEAAADPATAVEGEAGADPQGRSAIPAPRVPPSASQP